MIEFLSTLDPVQLSFFIVFLILALVILGIGSHHRINEIYDVGYEVGEIAANIALVDAKKLAYEDGYETGKKFGFLYGKAHAQQLATNPAKAPVNKSSKLGNSKRAPSGQNIPKPVPSKQKNANRSVKAVTTAKKPAQVAQSSRPRTKAKSS